MSKPGVEVLLATYNGASFLREQIDSVLAQQAVDIHILAHDDGSTDSTDEILAEYAAKHPQRFRVLQDDVRTGSAKGNFAHLLRASSAPYVAFCDQDDVWLPEKVSLSMDAMRLLETQQGTATPLLVYTDLRVMDEALRTISESLWQTNYLRHATSPTFAQLLTENVVTGCTALLNRPLVTLMRTMPAAAQMHDHWAALLTCGLGAMKAVPQATVLYRQHTSNVVGAIGPQPSLAAKLSRFVSRRGASDRAMQFAHDRAQAESLLQLHGERLPQEHRETIEAFLALPSQTKLQRLRTVTRYGLWRTDPQRRIAQAIDLLR